MPREKFRMHHEATKELAEAVSWHADRGEELADRFIGAVNDAIDKVLASPGRFANYFHRTRYVRIDGFTYLIVYRDVDEVVHVVAVAHTSRRPGYWRKRLRDIEET